MFTAISTESPIKRNILITAVMTAISVILCTLGFNTAARPIDSIAVAWPGAILQAVGTILFGGWGVVATLLAGMIANLINVGTPYAVFAYSIPNFLQAIIPAAYYRRLIKQYGFSEKIFEFKTYFVFASILPNLVGAITGTFLLFSSKNVDPWFSIARWLTANIPISLLLGWPLLYFLGPTMIEEKWFVKKWWQ